jgi:hypothetical protein
VLVVIVMAAAADEANVNKLTSVAAGPSEGRPFDAPPELVALGKAVLAVDEAQPKGPPTALAPFVVLAPARGPRHRDQEVPIAPPRGLHAPDQLPGLPGLLVRASQPIGPSGRAERP